MEKPKSWAVWNDGSQRFKDTVIKYMNDNITTRLSIEGVITDVYYGVPKLSDVEISKNKRRFSTILTLDEFCEIFLNEKKDETLETLEEAAEKKYENQSKSFENDDEPIFDISRYLVRGFIDGAKWQQNQTVSPNIDAVVDLLKSVSDETGVSIEQISITIQDGVLTVTELVGYEPTGVLKTFNINK
jgi:hypothetical protein